MLRGIVNHEKLSPMQMNICGKKAEADVERIVRKQEELGNRKVSS